MAKNMKAWHAGVAAVALGLSIAVSHAQAYDDGMSPPAFMGAEGSLVRAEHPPVLIDDEQALRDLPPPFVAGLPPELAPIADVQELLQSLPLPDMLALPAELTAPVALDAALQPLREALKASLAASGDAALRDAYDERDYAPIFVAADAVGPKAHALAERLALAADDGLNADAYALTLTEAATPAALADLELRLAKLMVAYARQASGGQVDTAKLSGYITVQPEFIAPKEALQAAAETQDIAATLDGFNPQHEGFQHLKAKLADLRSKAVPDAKTAQRQINTVLANMERWRWLPRTLGSSYIWVNIPEYQVRIYDNGAMLHQTRVVVGTAKTQTPIFSHEMETVVVNPAWNVPPSILAKEMLVAARRDPSYFSRRGYQVIKGGKVVDPASVDWSNPGRVAVRQPPGERNALGKMKFLFPNRHAVYLHDTPSRALFANERRAYSHGCVRVNHPAVFAEKVLGLSNAGENWSAGRIESLYGASERGIKLSRKLPIHLVYFTAEANSAGELTLREDIYGHDARVTQALVVSNAKVAQTQ